MQNSWIQFRVAVGTIITELNVDKTRLVEFGRWAERDRKRGVPTFVCDH